MISGSPTSTYTQFSFNIEYGSESFNVVPDSAYISITIVDTSSNPPVAGAYAYVDGLNLVL